jgi:hypothetical protein
LIRGVVSADVRPLEVAIDYTEIEAGQEESKAGLAETAAAAFAGA